MELHQFLFENPCFFVVNKMIIFSKNSYILNVKRIKFFVLRKLNWLWFSFPISFWHRFPNSNVILASEPMHGLDNSQNEEVSEQTPPVGFHSCVHWHCCIHCHYTEYFAALGTVWRHQSSQPPFTPQLSRDPSNRFKNLPSTVIRLWTLPDHHSGEKYTQKGVLHHICQRLYLVVFMPSRSCMHFFHF